MELERRSKQPAKSWCTGLKHGILHGCSPCILVSVKWSFLIALLLHSMFHGYIKDFVSQGLQADLGRVKTVQVMFYSASLPYFIWNCSWPSCSFQWNTLRHCLFFCRKEEKRARGWRRKEMSTSRKEVGWSSLNTVWMLENPRTVLSHRGGAAENPEEDLTPSLLNFITPFIFCPALEKRQRYQTSFRVV